MLHLLAHCMRRILIGVGLASLVWCSAANAQDVVDPGAKTYAIAMYGPGVVNYGPFIDRTGYTLKIAMDLWIAQYRSLDPAPRSMWCDGSNGPVLGVYYKVLGWDRVSPDSDLVNMHVETFLDPECDPVAYSEQHGYAMKYDILVRPYKECHPGYTLTMTNELWCSPNPEPDPDPTDIGEPDSCNL